MKTIHTILLAVMNLLLGLAIPFILLVALNVKKGNESNIVKVLVYTTIVFIDWLVFVIILYINTKSNKYSYLDAARVNMVVRLILAPVYIIVFIVCILFSITGPFALGVWAYAFLSDACILVITNIMSIPCYMSLSKNNIVQTWLSVILFLCQSMFCIDVVIAIILYVIVKKKL